MRNPAAFSSCPGSTLCAYSYDYQSKRRKECTEMISSPSSIFNVDLQPGKLPILHVAIGEPPCWAAEHRDTLRAFVAEHGALLVRGLGLHDASGIEAVFRRLGSLMAEKEAFTSRRSYSPEVYSASKLPPNQHLCVHHER